MAAGQERAPLLETLGAFAATHPSRFFVPGHKGGHGADRQARELIGLRAFQFDIPQGIEGVDLNVAETPLYEAEALAAEAHGADRSWLLTNGASQGNHALCIALAREQPVVVQRNSHTSVIDGLVLSGDRPFFATAEYDEQLAMALCVTPDALADAAASASRASSERAPSAAFIVSPTYYGATADIAVCARACHEAGLALVVDQAWGPHYGFSPEVPESALALGADAVLTSTHKIAGSLTQSAMLHARETQWLDIERLHRTVRLVRSTSPSALLLGSLDGARRQLAVSGRRMLADTLARGATARAQIAAIRGCELVPRRDDGWASVVAWDPMRIVIDVRGTGASGHEVAVALAREFNVHVELATHAVLVLVLGVNEPEAPLERFPEQLAAVAEKLARTASRRPGDGRAAPVARAPHPQAAEPSISPRQAWLADSERVAVDDAIGRISAEAIAGYPPGIPTLLPGERVTAAIVRYLRELVDVGVKLHGASDPRFDTLAVVVEPGAA
jgi:arginine decarboxylase